MIEDIIRKRIEVLELEIQNSCGENLKQIILRSLISELENLLYTFKTHNSSSS